MLLTRLEMVRTKDSDEFMYTRPLVVYMAKLYWRIKRNEKWTWVATTMANTVPGYGDPSDLNYQEEEE